jgi:Domain of unknown function (DUF4133)
MNHIAEVIKGVDDEIEFKGFKGRYFYALAIYLVGILLLVFILYAMGFTSFILFFTAIVFAGVGVFYIQTLNKKNGKYGHLRRQHRPPKHIIISQNFKSLLK